MDDIEPITPEFSKIRDARVKCVRLLNAFAAHVEAAILRPRSTKQDIAIAFYQPCYAMGLLVCGGVSMMNRAEYWGVERATISKGATEFCNGNSLPPSFYMKTEQAQKAYQKERINRIKRGCNKHLRRA